MARTDREVDLLAQISRLEKRIAELEAVECLPRSDSGPEFSTGEPRANALSPGPSPAFFPGKPEPTTLERLVAGTASVAGDEFFVVFARQLCEASGAAFACVSELADNRRLRILGVWNSRKTRVPAEYDVEDSPCEMVLENGEYFCPQELRRCFPRDQALQAIEAEGFFGVRFGAEDAKPLGLVCVVDDKRLVDSAELRTILRLFAGRAALELQRQRATAETSRLLRMVERQKDVLEWIASGRSLRQVLDAICHDVEVEIEDAVCSVITLDTQTGDFRVSAAPSMEREVRNILDNQLRGKPVTAGPATESRQEEAGEASGHVVWEATPDLNERQGLSGYWQVPILGDRQQIVGLVGVLLPTRRSLEQLHVQLVECAAKLAQVALQREETERQQRESEERYRTIAETANEAILTVDANAIIVFANPATERVFGHSLFDVIGQPLAKLIPDMHFEESVEAVEWQRPIEVRGVHRVGRTLVLESSFRRHLRGGKEYHTAVLRDVTQRKQVQEELERREAELAHALRLATMGEMVAQISHEVNQPLYAISNFAQACLRELSAGGNLDDVRDWLERIREASVRSGEILHRIAKFVRGGPSNRSPTSLNELVEESFNLTAWRTSQKRIEVCYESLDPDVEIEVDRVQLQQVLLNLLINACDAIEESGVEAGLVAVRARLTKEEIQIAVEDNGPGVDEDISREIFNPFVTTKARGMGMGLTISRSIVLDHGGRIWNQRNARGGTTFWVALPQENQAVDS